MATPFTKPAIPFTQTSRTGWLLTMTAGEITRILPAREPEQLSLFTDTNLPITPRHLGSIEKFLTDTPHWAMPAIVLSAAPGTIKSLKGTITGDSSALQVLDWTATGSKPSPIPCASLKPSRLTTKSPRPDWMT